MPVFVSTSRLLIWIMRALIEDCVEDIERQHENYRSGPADSDSTFIFRNIDTNSVHDKNSFEIN